MHSYFCSTVIRSLASLALVVFPAGLVAQTSGGPLVTDSPQVAGSQRLKASEEAIREQMMVISRQLGVNCSACHNLKNFASAEKREFGVAKEHMKITQILIDSGMDGRDKRPKADCYMCHRGQLKPAFKEPVNPLTR